MKRVLPTRRGRFPRRVRKAFTRMNDRSTIEDIEAKLIARLVPTISPPFIPVKRSESPLFFKSRVVFDKDSAALSGDNEAISQ